MNSVSYTVLCALSAQSTLTKFREQFQVKTEDTCKIGRMYDAWWRHQMETFSALLALCAGNSSVTGEFPTQRPVMRSFDVFFDLRMSKWLGKQCWGWWFEMPSRSLWRHFNEVH